MRREVGTPIDFTLPREVEEVRQRVRAFMDGEVRPVEESLRHNEADRKAWREAIGGLRRRARSCFAMTEPEMAGSDPTLIQTKAVRDGDDWVINGHKWFISGARGAAFAIVIACTDRDADPPQARNSAFLVDLPADGFEIVRDIDTMAGQGNHCEIRLTNVRVPAGEATA